MIRSILSACAALAIAWGSPALGADSKCKLIRIAEWPVRFQGNLPVIEGAIDGKKVGILLDTGAYASLVTKDAAERLGLATRITNDFAQGVGGASRILVTRLQELRVGDAVRTNVRVRVAGEQPIRGVDFILGDDFFKNIDMEFDYSKGVIRLFQAQDCKGAALAYWDPGAFQVPLQDESKIVLSVRVNGREGRALLASGASTSVVSEYFAAKLGITPQSPGVVPSGCASGIGPDVVHSWVAQFDTVAVGDELIRNPRLRIEDLMSEIANTRHAPPDMLLGTDFLRAHRVLVARSQEKVYFSYAGGLVFPATPGFACAERKGKSAAEQLAEYDEILAKNPDDTKALLGRALARSRNRNVDGALADLDAAIRLQPNDAVALYTRAGLRASQKHYDTALTDVDGAIANGMHVAQAYLFRASISRAKGDDARALRDLDEAVKLEPTNREALRMRARFNFLMGRHEDADRDYTALLQVQHTPFDAIWLQMTRARQGLDARAELEQELATLKDGAWPAPILSFQLGRLDREALIVAAESAEEKERRSRLCEARYYAAERHLVDGAKAEARPLLEKAVAECPRNFIEYDSALVELNRLR